MSLNLCHDTVKYDRNGHQDCRRVLKHSVILVFDQGNLVHYLFINLELGPHENPQCNDKQCTVGKSHYILQEKVI